MEFSPLTWVYSYLFNSYIQIGVKKNRSFLCIPIFAWYLGHIPQQGSLTLLSKLGPSKGQQLAEGCVSVADEDVNDADDDDGIGGGNAKVEPRQLKNNIPLKSQFQH